MSSLIRFIRDVSSHQLSVIRDEGLYRHLCFSRPNSRAYSFDIITWPGYLTITGDMGTWTFSRITDMFEFFTDGHFGARSSFQTNPSYWSEKFEAGNRRSQYDSPCFEFDDEQFQKGLRNWLANYIAECDDEHDREMAKDAVSDLCSQEFRNEWMATQAIHDAYFPSDVCSWDVAEHLSPLQKYCHSYIWICFAIVWGIERYQTKKLVTKAMSTFLAFRQLA